MDSGVLFISPHRKDAGTLSRMLGPTQLRVDHVTNLEEAGNRLRQDSYGAILTEAALPDGDWMDVLNLTYEIGSFPAVIVTHRLADDRLWAEVLNLGAYDLLAQPFDTSEVQRILTHACTQAMAKPACARPIAKSKSVAAAL